MLNQLHVRSLVGRCWAQLVDRPRLAFLAIILPAAGVFGWIAFLGAIMSPFILGAMGLAVARGSVPSDVGLFLLLALWGPAGLVGLLSRWMWALLPLCVSEPLPPSITSERTTDGRRRSQNPCCVQFAASVMLSAMLV